MRLNYVTASEPACRQICPYCVREIDAMNMNKVCGGGGLIYGEALLPRVLDTKGATSGENPHVNSLIVPHRFPGGIRQSAAPAVSIGYECYSGCVGPTVIRGVQA